MGHNPPPKVQEIQKKNLANFDSWVTANSKLITPAKGTAIIYAGYPEGEFQKMKTFLGSDPKMRRMYQIVEVAHRQQFERSAAATYQTLEVVLRNIRNPSIKIYEAINDSNGNPRKFADMWDCANMLTTPVHGLLDRGQFAHVWDKLSEQYVKNSSGEVEIWMGSKANHKLIDQSTTMIRAELKALIERAELPKATAENASRIIIAFCDHHRNQKIFSEKLMNQALAILHNGRKR